MGGDICSRLFLPGTVLWKKHILYQIRLRQKPSQFTQKLIQNIKSIQDFPSQYKISDMIENIQVQKQNKVLNQQVIFNIVINCIKRQIQSNLHPLNKLIRKFGYYFDTKYNQIINPSQITQQYLVQQFFLFISYLVNSLILFFNLDVINDRFINIVQIFNIKNMSQLATNLMFNDYHVQATLFNIQCNICCQKNYQLNFYMKKNEAVSLHDVGVSQQFILDNDSFLMYYQKMKMKNQIIKEDNKFNWNQLSENMKLIPMNQNPTYYNQCIEFFKGMIYFRNPQTKLCKFKELTVMLENIIINFYRQRNIPHKLIPCLDADNLISIFIYIIIKSKIPNLFTHLKMVELYAQKEVNQVYKSLNSIGGYTLSCLNACLEFIKAGTVKCHSLIDCKKKDYRFLLSLMNYLNQQQK